MSMESERLRVSSFPSGGAEEPVVTIGRDDCEASVARDGFFR